VRKKFSTLAMLFLQINDKACIHGAFSYFFIIESMTLILSIIILLALSLVCTASVSGDSAEVESTVVVFSSALLQPVNKAVSIKTANSFFMVSFCLSNITYKVLKTL
jgi:hypothetical protein